MVERGGEIITRVVPDVKRKTLERHILRKVDRSASVSTDELPSYKRLYMYGYKHASVNHGREEYVRGKTHTNTIELVVDPSKAVDQGDARSRLGAPSS